MSASRDKLIEKGLDAFRTSASYFGTTSNSIRSLTNGGIFSRGSWHPHNYDLCVGQKCFSSIMPLSLPRNIFLPSLHQDINKSTPVFIFFQMGQPPVFHRYSTQSQGEQRTNLGQNSASKLAAQTRKSHMLTSRVQKINAERSRSMLLYLTAIVVSMVGLTYSAVPLYRMFCQATGYGGTVKRLETIEDRIARHDESDVQSIANKRELVVQFNADVADGMPWKFVPSQHEVKVKPGQSTLAFYTAHNLSNQPITGVSTYNITPMKAGAYFNKIQCFCFEEQRLQPGEKIDMPVFFYIDPEFALDPKMKDVNSLILSYTFFKVDSEK